MRAKSAIKYIRPPTPVTHVVRRVVSVAVVFALLIVSAGVFTFTSANSLMRRDPDPLPSFSSNIMPAFSVISFQSLDEQTTLSGWMFPAKGDPVSTVILVHDINSNRLQFGIDMPALYEFFVESGYNVLSFDLRHAGKSEGQMSAYGYAEWEDVIAAIDYARRFTTTQDVLLYGFGSGVTATLLAWSKLPERTAVETGGAGEAMDADESTGGTGDSAGAGKATGGSGDSTGAAGVSGKADSADLGSTQSSTDAPLSFADQAIQDRILSLGFDQSYVRGVLLDTPTVSPDHYIQAVFRRGNPLGRVLLQFTVPYAVRLSASSNSPRSLVPILTRIQRPVFIAYSDKDNFVGRRSIVPLVNERVRLHPDTTAVYVDPQPGYVESYPNDPASYLAALEDYLSRYIG